jgi:dipeptidyl aminopeptidase/acylaminoacyl peptidase
MRLKWVLPVAGAAVAALGVNEVVLSGSPPSLAARAESAAEPSHSSRAHSYSGLCAGPQPGTSRNPAVAFVMEQHYFAPNESGRRDTLYATSLDGTRVWRLQRGALVAKPSPDGLRLAYVVDVAGGLRIRDLTGRCHRSFGNADEPAWSPDGRHLAFTTPNLFVANDAGQLAQLTTEFVEAPSWSPNGRELAFSRHDDLWVAHADGKGAHVVTTRNEFCWAGAVPQWLLDNATIAFCGHDPRGCADESLQAVSLNTRAVRTLRRTCIHTLARSPRDDAVAVLYTEQREKLTVVNPHSGRADVLKGITGSVDPDSLAWSHNGRFLLVSMRGQIWIVRRDGRTLRQITHCEQRGGACIEPQWLTRQPPAGLRVRWSDVN